MNKFAVWLFAFFMGAILLIVPTLCIKVILDLSVNSLGWEEVIKWLIGAYFTFSVAIPLYNHFFKKGEKK